MRDARHCLIALCVLLFLLSGAAQAEPQLRCHIELTGDSRELEFSAVSDPYGVQPIDLGSDFRFKAVLVGDQGSIEYLKIYVYFQTPRREMLLHSARFLAPPLDAKASLTGLNHIYAPGLERELKYECRLSEAKP
jgi:hypothetical protein